ncbi:uncharacterized protein NPIL_612681 [Nephila pilipes]|uniref:Uncharacterized protein n=1 Tax=Nephila pilipes TaxID=299642 RepID=A0A8X6QYW6_NEPPI|nr:uncharacterized protein NPIL_612681 [Nephila pilipes]
MAANGVTKQFGIPVVFSLLLIPWGWCEINNCDVERCIHLYQEVYKDFLLYGSYSACRKVDDIIKCSNDCIELFFPDLVPIFSKTSILHHLCSYDFKYELGLRWKCIGENFHRLVTCMSLTGSMTALSNSSDVSRRLTCKKVIEILDCPYEVLYNCDEEVVETVNELFKVAFKSLMNFSCSNISIGNALDLPVNYITHNNWTTTATCLDDMPTTEMIELTNVCFGQYMQKAANYELYKCSDIPGKCGRLDNTTCLPTHLVNDFFIPLLSFGKNCRNVPREDKPQMQDSPRTTTSISYDDSGTQDYHVDIKDVVYPSDKSYSNSPFDETTLNTESSFENIGLEPSTPDSGLWIKNAFKIISSSKTTIITDSSSNSPLTDSSLNIDREMINDMDYSNTLEYAENNAAYEINFNSSHLIILVIGLIFF